MPRPRSVDGTQAYVSESSGIKEMEVENVFKVSGDQNRKVLGAFYNSLPLHYMSSIRSCNNFPCQG